jgi:hypothetical protein
MGALQFPQFVTEALVSGVMAISQFRAFGLLKQAKDSRNLYAKLSFPVALDAADKESGGLWIKANAEFAVRVQVFNPKPRSN